ncbi:hypothetical protein BRC81_15985 [Halobacteriales archaeon QS_1_68_20]|nr:MAG: hypothetical protein BRC81_15985 [Halobacteriales archaeon QS_1_68_20]
MTADGTTPQDGRRDRGGDDTASVQAFYGRWAGLYDLVARWTPGVGSMRASAADALALRPGETVVDVGCGSGANLPYLRERVGPAGTVIGIDVTGPLIARARLRVHEEGWENVHLVRADARRPPVAEADAMVASFVVGMFDDPAAVVDGWCDLLAPGGRLALLHAAPSERRAARPVNAALEAVTVLSTPPTHKLRYERDLTRKLADSVEAAHGRLAARATAYDDREFLLGLVRLAAGRLPDEDSSDEETD